MIVRMSRAALAVAALVALAGCSSTPEDPNAQPYEAKEYRTGSNIPVRDRTQASGVTSAKPDDPAFNKPWMPAPVGNTRP